MDEENHTDVTGRNAEAHPRAGKRNSQKILTIRQQQNADRKTSSSKNRLPTKLKNAKLEENWSKAIKDAGGSGSDKDLDIDVEAFVNHVPVLEDVDQAVSSSCPFCSVLYEDVTQHIKDCHNSGEITVGTFLYGDPTMDTLTFSFMEIFTLSTQLDYRFVFPYCFPCDHCV